MNSARRTGRIGFGVFAAPLRVLATLLHNKDGTYTTAKDTSGATATTGRVGEIPDDARLPGAGD